MTKKLLLLLIALLFFCNAQAQISDADAKILYQQAEDAYNQSNYYTASQKALTLQQQMGQWTPKVLYLHLKSAYKDYTNTSQSSSYKKDYNTFFGFASLCDNFFKLIDKNNYPADKYNEIQDIQTYFKSKTEEYAATKDRTPQDAVDFLNECAKKFPNQSVEDEDDGFYKNYIFDYNIIFELQNTILLIRNNCKQHDPSAHFPYWSTHKHVTYIDLSKITSINFRKADRYNGIYASANLEGFTTYDEDGKKVMAGIVSYSVSGCCDKVKANKVFNDTSVESSKIAFQSWKHESAPNDFGLNVLYNFNKSSQEFIDGKYDERIKDAFQFLIDYFPKTKEEKTEQPKSKF